AADSSRLRRGLRAHRNRRGVVQPPPTGIVTSPVALPQLYIPAADVDTSVLTNSGQLRETPQGRSTVHSLTHGDRHVDQAARLITDAAVEGLAATYRFEWAALDAWFEEDEEMFLHVRSPYVRVDSLRSSRPPPPATYCHLQRRIRRSRSTLWLGVAGGGS
ncbi:MAG: hypothetical protein WA966_10390, partial [Ornithinimicrobium sp.]